VALGFENISDYLPVLFVRFDLQSSRLLSRIDRDKRWQGNSLPAGRQASNDRAGAAKFVPTVIGTSPLLICNDIVFYCSFPVSSAASGEIRQNNAGLRVAGHSPVRTGQPRFCWICRSKAMWAKKHLPLTWPFGYFWVKPKVTAQRQLSGKNHILSVQTVMRTQ